MSRTIAEDLVDTLTKAGVQRIYGIVGDSLNPVTDAIRRSGKVQWVHVRHEETAAFAAGAEAQLTGQLAVCAGSCGPGNLHLINGLYDAHRSMAPVLAIAAHIPSSEIGTGYFQETHPDQLFRECSHYCELVSNPRQMPRSPADRHAARGEQTGRFRDRAVRRCRGPGGALGNLCPWARHRAAGGTACGHRPGPPGRPSEQGAAGDALLRQWLCRRARRGRGPGPEAQGAGRLRLPRQGMARVRQPVRRGHDRPLGLGGRVQGHARMRRPAVAWHGFPLRDLHADEPPGRPDRPSRRAAGPAVQARPGPVRRCPRHDPSPAAARGAEGRPDVPGRHARTAKKPQSGSSAPTSITSARGGRSTPSTSPPRSTNWPARMRCSPWIPGCAAVWGARYLRAAAGRRFLGSFNHGSMANALPQAIGARRPTRAGR